MVMAPTYAKIQVLFSKCDNMIGNIQIHMSWQVFFLVWNFGQMWKINMKKEYLIIFLKKTVDMQKNEKHVVTFPYWFWFDNKILNVK